MKKLKGKQVVSYHEGTFWGTLNGNNSKCNCNDRKFAFTMSEAVTVIAILGILAALTVPSIIKKYSQTANRTKVKKAMATYDAVLNTIINENNLRDNAKIAVFANGNNCQNAKSYFKVNQSGGTDCQFKTSDGVWWNIENILRPVIYLNKEGITLGNKDTVTIKANDNDDKSAFILVGHYDPNKVLRIDDLDYELVHGVQNSDRQMTKLYEFINNKKLKENLPAFLANCHQVDDTHYACGGVTFTPRVGDGSCVTPTSGLLAGIEQCGTTDKVWVPENPISPSIYGTDVKSEENCATSTYSNCSSTGDYYNAAKRYCENIGTELASIGDLQSLGYTDGRYWAADEYEYGSDSAYNMQTGTVIAINKGVKRYSIVCVGR